MPAPTLQQQRAIGATGDVLVMAGAGAGKTSTLVARILDRVVDSPARVPLDRVLVVTFNEAAAAELRHRLRLALEARVRERPDDPWLAESLALLETAQVSTLHAFCLRLLREHFHEVGLDPQFTVQDETQGAILRDQVLDEVLRGHYRGDAPQAERVRAFLERHAPDGDEPVRDLVLRTWTYASTLAESGAWLAGLRADADRAEPEAWRRALGPGLAAWAAGWAGFAAGLAQADASSAPAAGCAAVLAAWPAPGSAPGASGIAAVAERLRAVVDWGDDRHYPRGKKGLWRDPLKKLFDEAEEVLALIASPDGAGPDPLVEDWAWVRADLAALLDLVEQFSAALTAAKRSLAAVDFSDLEQHALTLLWDPARSRPTPLALEWRGRLDHVLVDEYQDINGAQDRILACLSREGAAANRFLVGDVKQSIYRFRRADPRIFQRYATAWRTAGGAGRSTVIPLSENFRSHEAILGFVNELFDGLMRPSVGGVAYDAEARLQFGAPEARAPLRDRSEGRVEVHLQLVDSAGGEAGTDEEAGDASGDGAVEDLDAEERQAGLVAARLRDLHAAGLGIWDAAAGGLRPVRWSDMVVLHPAPRPVAERWARQFSRAGIPLEARRGGFYDAPEVSDLVNLARILDNPLQDLPLLAVLRSPLVGMSVDELAAVRMARRSGRFWEALEAFAAAGALPPEVAADAAWRAAGVSAREKAAWFLVRFRRWRRLGQEGSLAWCLETALAETAYEAWIAAGPRSDARLANLRRLLALSRQFDQFQRHGLFRFLRFLDAQNAAGQEASSAPATAGDAVRLMSVHQSKGLEFPVVVVAGLGRRFNLRDLHAEWLIDEECGLCPPVLPPGRLRGYPSLTRWLAGRRQRRDALGEQIRLLYVACTRASERLLLVGTARGKQLEDWAAHGPELSDRDLVQASHPLAWIGPRLGLLTGNPNWAAQESGRGSWLDWVVHRDGGVPRAEAPSPEAAPQEALPAGDFRDLREALAWTYPWPSATQEPAKTAVTALRRRWAVPDEDAAGWPWNPGGAAVPAAASGGPGTAATGSGAGGSGGARGAFRLSEEPTARAMERGLAHHLFCEMVDLAATGSLGGLEAERDRLLAEGWLRPEQREELDLEGLAGFWLSPLGERLRAHAPAVQRELPFTLRLRPSDLERLGHPGASAGLAPGDFQVVQGVADLAVVLPDEIWLVDFKTDRVEGAALAARADEYRVQLRLYAFALGEIFRRPVTERWLYFIHARELVAVSPA